jgi:hypothetical protein
MARPAWRSHQTIYFALGSLLHILIPGVIVALALAGLATWLLARQAMRDRPNPF